MSQKVIEDGVKRYTQDDLDQAKKDWEEMRQTVDPTNTFITYLADLYFQIRELQKK